MFTNVIGQNNMISLIKNDLSKKRLASSMIFYGNSNIGKLTTALELVRVMNCNFKGDSFCECSNCVKIKSLSFSGLLFLSRRSFYYYILEYINSYKRDKNEKYVERIKYYITLSLLPLQDFLIEGVVYTPDKKIISELSEYFYENIISKQQFTSVDLDTILKKIAPLESIYKTPNVPINTIRAMLDWTYIKQPNVNRAVIIDGIEYFEESSQNILLKRLEESGENLYFILITGNITKIYNTIKSRCRLYFFKNLNREDLRELLKRNFNENDSYSSMKDFFNRSNKLSKMNIYDDVVNIINHVFLKDYSLISLIDLITKLSDRNKIRNIFEEIITIFENELLERERQSNDAPEIKALRKISYSDLESILNLMKITFDKFEKFNLNSVLTLEGIFYPIKSMVENNEI